MADLIIHRKIAKRGDELLVSVPRDLAEACGLGEGQYVSVTATGEALILKHEPVAPGQEALQALLGDSTPDTYRRRSVPTVQLVKG